MKRTVVVAGATGFVGRHVVSALVKRGHTVIGASRHPDRARLLNPDIAWTHLDVDDQGSLERALIGADAMVYLVHQMTAKGADLMARECASAERVRLAAERCGMQRIVYLGGPEPDGNPSEHLRARLETGRILRAGAVSTIELQAAMIIGTGSESWLIVRDLAFRLPLMVLPQWLQCRSQPIGVTDVVTAIATAVELEGEQSMCLPLPGPETLTARDILLRVAGARGTRPLMLPVPVLTPSLSSHWIRFVTRADYTIARKLVDGLTSDLIAGPQTFWTRFPELQPTPLDTAIRTALQGEGPHSMPDWQHRWEQLVGIASLRA